MIFTLFHFPLVSKDNSQIFHVSGENTITITEKMKGCFYKTCMSTFPHADGGWSDSSFKLNILLCQWLGSLSLPGPRSSEERCGQWHSAPAALGSYSRVWGLSDTAQKQSRPERCLIYVRVLRRSEHGKIQVHVKVLLISPPPNSSAVSFLPTRMMGICFMKKNHNEIYNIITT